MDIEAINSVNFWNNIHTYYERDQIKTDDWLKQSPLKEIIDDTTDPILDLGCGDGNDDIYLISRNKTIFVCDQSENAISNIKKNFPEIKDTRIINMLDGLDYPDDFFGTVIADLTLHYFTENDTQKILSDIRRILKPNGHLIIRVNTVNDINHGAGQGEEIEHHLYRTPDGMLKRFFDEQDIYSIFKDFDIYLCEEQKMLRYKSEKIVYCVGMKSR